MPGPGRVEPGRGGRVDGTGAKYSVADRDNVPGPNHRVSVCDVDWAEHWHLAGPGVDVAGGAVPRLGEIAGLGLVTGVIVCAWLGVLVRIG